MGFVCSNCGNILSGGSCDSCGGSGSRQHWYNPMDYEDTEEPTIDEIIKDREEKNKNVPSPGKE